MKYLEISTVFCVFRETVVGISPQDHENQHRFDESFHPVPEFLKLALSGQTYEQIIVLGVWMLELDLETIIIRTAVSGNLLSRAEVDDRNRLTMLLVQAAHGFLKKHSRGVACFSVVVMIIGTAHGTVCIFRIPEARARGLRIVLSSTFTSRGHPCLTAHGTVCIFRISEASAYGLCIVLSSLFTIA